MVEGCVVQWKGQTPRLFQPPRDPVDLVEHNVWNPMMKLRLHVRIDCIFELFVEEINLARITLSCYFALDVLCAEEGALFFEHLVRHHCLGWKPTIKGYHCLMFVSCSSAQLASPICSCPKR